MRNTTTSTVAEGLKIPRVNMSSRKVTMDRLRISGKFPLDESGRKKSLVAVTQHSDTCLSLSAAQLEFFPKKKRNHLQSQGIVFKIHPHPYVAT